MVLNFLRIVLKQCNTVEDSFNDIEFFFEKSEKKNSFFCSPFHLSFLFWPFFLLPSPFNGVLMVFDVV